MRVAIGSDHAGIDLRAKIRQQVQDLGHEVVDLGTNDPTKADYPFFGQAVANAVASGDCDRGIVICGTGVGISISANKVPGIRCVVCSEPYSAVLSRNHNDSNVLAMGARVVGDDLAKMIVDQWIDAPFEGGRHQRRVNQIALIDAGGTVEDQVDPGVIELD